MTNKERQQRSTTFSVWLLTLLLSFPKGICVLPEALGFTRNVIANRIIFAEVQGMPTKGRGSIQSAILLLAVCSESLLQGCKSKPDETRTDVRSGDYKVMMRTQEFHHSGSLNVDVCVAPANDTKFPNKPLQCFLHGYDFSDLQITWRSPTEVVINFRCGRVTQFSNSAVVNENGPAPQEFYAFLNDSCTPHDRFGGVKE